MNDFNGYNIKIYREIFSNEIRYVILHNWDSLNTNIKSDLDIMVHPNCMQKLDKNLLNDKNIKVLQIIKHEASCYYIIIKIKGDNNNFIWPLDISTDYRAKGQIIFTHNDFLNEVNEWQGLKINTPENEFKYLIVKKVIKQKIDIETFKRLKSLKNNIGKEGDNILINLFGKKYAETINTYLQNNNFELFVKKLSILKYVLLLRNFKRKPLNIFKYIYQEIKRISFRLNNPTGLFIVVLGPDGAGKTTLIDGLERKLNKVFRNTRRWHFRPQVFFNKDKNEIVSNPHKLPYRSKLFSFLKLMYYLLDYWYGYFFIIKPKLIKSHLIIFDRYIDDIYIDPNRYRLNCSEKFLKIMANLAPKPDLYLILNASDRKIIDRKQEIPLKKLVEINAKYKNSFTHNEKAIFVNADLNKENVIESAINDIENYLNNRYMLLRKNIFR